MVGDVLNVIGGSFLAYAQLQVDFIGVATVTIDAGGHGGTDGTYDEAALVIQDDHNFFNAHFSAVISGGSLVEIGVFDTGAYTSEIMGTVTLDGVVAGVTGLTGAMATLTWSVANPLIGPPGVSILAGGDYTATPSNPVSVDGISGFEFDATWSGGGSLVSIDDVAFRGRLYDTAGQSVR